MDAEYLNNQFVQKIEYESEKIKAMMLGTSKANIYASSKEIHIKKYIRNNLFFEFNNYEQEEKLILLGVSDLIENVYSTFSDREKTDMFYGNSNQEAKLHEIINEIIRKEGKSIAR